METLLNRRLSRDEHVHHLDGNRHNNHPSNLQVLSAVSHGYLTRPAGLPLVQYCAWCGKPFARACAGHYARIYCSRTCANRRINGCRPPRKPSRMALLAASLGLGGSGPEP